MKTLIMSDLLSQRSGFGQMAFILVLVDAIMLICMQSPEAALAGVAVMVPFLVCYSLAVSDEMSGWDRMRLTLPAGRGTVVRSRYASVVLIALATCAIAFVLNFVLLAVIGAIPQLSSWLGGMALTGEKVAGFRNKKDGHFTEVMLIRSPEDEERFRKLYNVKDLPTEY